MKTSISTQQEQKKTIDKNPSLQRFRDIKTCRRFRVVHYPIFRYSSENTLQTEVRNPPKYMNQCWHFNNAVRTSNPASPHATSSRFVVRILLLNTLRTGLLNCLNARSRGLTFRQCASCIQGQAFRYSPENAFYIFNQQIYFII